MPWNRPIHEVSFVAFDLEATGLTPMVDTVTEVGAVRFRITRDGTVKQGPVMALQFHLQPDVFAGASLAACMGISILNPFATLVHHQIECVYRLMRSHLENNSSIVFSVRF